MFSRALDDSCSNKGQSARNQIVPVQFAVSNCRQPKNIIWTHGSEEHTLKKRQEHTDTKWSVEDILQHKKSFFTSIYENQIK